MIASRSANGRKADFMAFTVNHCRVSQSYPKASLSAAISLLIEHPDISRLSVLTVTRNFRSVSSPIGCSAIDVAAPVYTLDVGAISSGIRLSRT